MSERVGIVVIGRNEGERLRRCLRSLRGARAVVYVDSGSTDGSVTLAEGMGVAVVNLDLSRPFTMARGRNAGFARLTDLHPRLEFVQFIDGDCELVAGWLEEARRTLEQRPEVAVVFGRRRERHPERSIYNRLIDIEWGGPAGDTACWGGDAMIRAACFRAVGGFRESMIAGEEPEQSVRLGQRGWVITRLDRPMTIHDVAMTRFGQWWKRSVRGGHAYAEGAALHGRGPTRHHLRPSLSIWFWAAALPAAALAPAWPTHGWSLVLLLLYPLQIARIAAGRRSAGDRAGLAWTYGTFCMLAKWAQAIGQARYVADRWRGRPSVLIEYKGAA